MALLLGCTPEPGTVPQASSRDPGAVERGRYLFDAANCAGCHTDSAHGGARLAGGRGIESPFGTYYSRNITPDPRTGIGAWSDADFLRALRRGISPSGAHYFPVFPFPAFTGMTDRDILDIRAYLATQPPVVQADRAHDVSFPFDMRLIMVPWRALYFAPGPLTPLPQRDATWNRGRYLARAVVHCPECHTPRNGLGALETDRWLGGGIVGKDDKAPNITSDPTDGIGKWSEDDIVEVLTSGVLPDGDMVGGPMREVAEGTAKLSDADRRAIATYIKTIPPQPSAAER
jgi:mono/diheme cytochrome c family protein